jgi:hypothetical protein
VEEPVNEFDGPWKEALDAYFRLFLELLFPHIASDVDWERAIEFLDAELQKIAPEAEAGRGSVDKLVRVWSKSGIQEEMLVHIEVQSQKDIEFPHRMYRYNHRLEDRYGRMPVSIAVLGDGDRWWSPEEFQTGRWGCSVKFIFPIAKLMDYFGREAELEEHSNPFAAFVLAHLKTNETQGNPDARLGWKLRIAKRLYDRGMSSAEIRKLFRLVDWVMALPPPQATAFSRDMEAFEKEKEVPFITSTERVWLEEGRTAGRAEGLAESLAEVISAHQTAIEMCLKLKFAQPGVDLMPRVRAVTDPTTLEAFLKAIETAPDVDTLRALLPPQS